jgi:hypothetical protein
MLEGIIPYTYYNKERLLKFLDIHTKYGVRADYFVPEFCQITDGIVTPILQETLLGQRTVDDALKNITERTNQLLATNGRLG